MLLQRVITAIVLAVIFLAAVATLQLDALALIFGLVAVAGVWEWGSLAGWRVPWQRGLYAMCFAVGLVLLWSVYGFKGCLLYTSPSPRDRTRSRMPSSA